MSPVAKAVYKTCMKLGMSSILPVYTAAMVTLVVVLLILGWCAK